LLFLKNVHVANGSHTNHVRKSGARAGMLPVSGFAAQLTRDLGDLAKAGWSDGMTHGDQSA
jgi:hypothetical protein